MSSAVSPAAGQPTADVAARPDAQAPLPVTSRALLVKHHVLLREYDVRAMLRTIYAARGKEGIVKDPCFRAINAVNDRVSKDLEGYGFSQRDVDKVLVRFFCYVFELVDPDLEEAWDTYKKKSFDARGRFVG
ncbi:uncharacterized protein BDW70DRAFT_84444 [Aspergillus foveolatus]|uniref:uncharacterized protein n=1 Tax=Aspergillus foveolatus TaxID=210207 RepID=UPI003CCCF512